MAPNRPRRVHRLPQRLDWTLIPAPLDLSLPDLTEKSPLPAIIVTPSSPSCEKDFSIAFLAPPPKPTLTERIKTTITSPVRTKFPSSTSSNPFKMTARLMIILALMMFVMAAHVITHRLATQRPHLDFRVMAEGEESPMSSWFGFRELWAGASDGDGGDGYDAAFEESSKHDVVGIPVEGGAWISSDAVVVKHRKHGGHGHSSQERDVDFVVVEDPPNSPAPAPVPAPQ